MELDVGAVVKLETKSGSFEGLIHAVDRIHNRLTLEKVYLAETKERLPGRHHFFHNEITNVLVIEHVKKKVKEVKHGKSIIKRKNIPSHLSSLKDFKASDVVLSQIDSSDENNGDGESNTSKEDTDDYHVLTEINKTFVEAIDYLSKQKFLGFGAEGIELSRNGKLCWIQMATRDTVILFDMISLGKDSIDAGIGKILECPDIQKIIHDCRHLSDMFFHQYGVKLINVFDTQVAAAIASRNENDGFFPNYVDSLPQCLSIYLNIDDDKLIWTKYREGRQQEDMAVWAERPARKTLMRLAYRKVKHLRELRVALMEIMLDDFTSGVDIFLSIVRDSSAIELKENRHRLQPHLLPYQFTNLQDEAARRKSKYYDRYQGSKTTNGQNGNKFHTRCINRDPTIVFSHDSIWHENTRGTTPWVHSGRRGTRAHRQDSNVNGSSSGPSHRITNGRESDVEKSEDDLRKFHESLEEKPLAEKTLVEKPLAEKPLEEKPLAEKTFAEKPLADNPAPVHKTPAPVFQETLVQQTEKNLKIVDSRASPALMLEPTQLAISAQTRTPYKSAQEPQAVSRSIADYFYDLTFDDSDDEDVRPSTHEVSSTQFRYIAAGHESTMAPAKAGNAPVVLCHSSMSKSREFETDYSIIPSHSSSRASGTFVNPDSQNCGSSLDNTDREKDLGDRTAQSQSGLGASEINDDRTAAVQPGESSKHKNLSMSSNGAIYDSNDSGNESGHAINSPKKGLGRGMLLKSYLASKSKC